MANPNGRPQVENPRQSVLGVRLTAAEHSKIKQYAFDHHQTISQVVLEGLDLLYSKEKTKA